ncbi:MAG TPA: phosphate ABC transporter substrate-binding protein PstS [Kofleriaceae bacterium]|nr:phosphate ABC transporter substrate-binding protein PstS [Kofleriaceae bacterium]
MKLQAARIAQVITLGTLGALSLVGCYKKDQPATPAATGSAQATAPATGGNATLNASGSTFQKAFQEVAIESFTKANSTIKINYGGGGSGKGRQDFADMVTDFGCTDGAYKDEEKAKVKGGEFVYVPILLGAITVSYNIDGVDKLQLSADTIAKIFQRDIKKWNDAAIAADNPGVTLPDLDIVVAHRSDGSGTTQQFTLFLTNAATSSWKLKSASTIEWPADTQAGNGNGGVAQIVKSTKGAIGYVDLPDAKASGLKYASVKNASGKFIEPSSASAQAAGDGIEVQADLTFVAVNAKGDATYPITMPSWCIVYTKPADKAKGAALKRYFNFMVTDAQKMAPEIDYAPLPKTLQDKAIAAVAKIEG